MNERQYKPPLDPNESARILGEAAPDVMPVVIDPRLVALAKIRAMSLPENKRGQDYEDVTTEGNLRPISW